MIYPPADCDMENLQFVDHVPREARESIGFSVFFHVYVKLLEGKSLHSSRPAGSKLACAVVVSWTTSS